MITTMDRASNMHFQITKAIRYKEKEARHEKGYVDRTTYSTVQLRNREETYMGMARAIPTAPRGTPRVTAPMRLLHCFQSLQQYLSSDGDGKREVECPRRSPTTYGPPHRQHISNPHRHVIWSHPTERQGIIQHIFSKIE